jgi:hypothetical protein
VREKDEVSFFALEINKNYGLDVVEWLERLTANVEIATVSILQHSGI